MAVTLLAILGTLVYIIDSETTGPGKAFMIGIGCGVMGEGLVKLGKSQIVAAIREGMRAAYETMSGKDVDKPNKFD